MSSTTLAIGLTRKTVKVANRASSKTLNKPDGQRLRKHYHHDAEGRSYLCLLRAGYHLDPQIRQLAVPEEKPGMPSTMLVGIGRCNCSWAGLAQLSSALRAGLTYKRTSILSQHSCHPHENLDRFASPWPLAYYGQPCIPPII